MTDQATRLRGLMERQLADSSPQSNQDNSDFTPKRAQTIAVTSGKGGVGKSLIALNLAVAMSQRGKSVCLIDANLGLGNLDLLCGLNGYWNLSHVISGSRRIEQILLEGPNGIHLLPGANGLHELENCNEEIQNEIVSQLKKLEEQYDVIVIDTGSGIHRSVRQFALSADEILIMTTSELTSIADAYSTIKTLASSNAASLKVVINRSSEEVAYKIKKSLRQTTNVFLHTQTSFSDAIPEDPTVIQSVAAREPFLIREPNCPAALAVKELAKELDFKWTGHSNKEPYFARLGAEMLAPAA